MNSFLPETLQPLLNLAKAREILIVEAQSHMPRAQGRNAIK